MFVARVGNCQASEDGDSFWADAEESHVCCKAVGAGVDSLTDFAGATVYLLYLSFIELGWGGGFTHVPRGAIWVFYTGVVV